MAECLHEYRYNGVLNVFKGAELVKIYESWRCAKCGAVKVSVRGPGVTHPAEGLLPDPGSPEKRWIVLICQEGEGKAEVLAAEPGEELSHKCASGEVRFRLDAGLSLKTPDGREPKNHYVVPLEEVATGFIDLSEKPPKIVRTP